jgi:hypothetical protein
MAIRIRIFHAVTVKLKLTQKPFLYNNISFKNNRLNVLIYKGSTRSLYWVPALFNDLIMAGHLQGEPLLCQLSIRTLFQ